MKAVIGATAVAVLVTMMGSSSALISAERDPCCRASYHVLPKLEVTYEDGFSKVGTSIALIGCGDRLKALSASEREKTLAALRSAIKKGDVIPGSAAADEKYRAQLVARINAALGSDVVGDILFLGTSYVDLGEKVE